MKEVQIGMKLKNYLENENFVLIDYPEKDHTEVLFIKKIIMIKLNIQQ